MRQFVLLVLLTIPGIALFSLLLGIRIFHDQMPILFYRGLTMAVIAFAIHLSVLWITYRKSAPELKLASATLAASFNVCFLVIFPVTIERSVSVYLLGQIERSGDGISEAALEERFVRRYVHEFGAVRRRIVEQQASNNIRIEDGRIHLTDQGRSFLDFSRVLGRLFNIDMRLLSDSAAVDTTAAPDSLARP